VKKEPSTIGLNAGFRMAEDFILVKAEDFGWLDLEFYDRVASEFELEGFSLIGDIECIPFREFFPGTFHRTMCSRDGMIVAEIYHQKSRGLDAVLRLLFGRWPSYKGIHLSTEFSDGGLVYTITGKKRKTVELTSKVSKQIVGRKMRVRDMIEVHKERIKKYIKENPDAQFLAIRSFENWKESLGRLKDMAKNV
jgi:hypothetical protein